MDFFKRKDAQWSDLKYLTTRYKSFLAFSEMLFWRSQMMKVRMKTYSTGWMSYGFHLDNMMSPAGENYWFRLLFRVAVLVLVTPHSNAGFGCLYSLVNKNKPQGSDRNRMDIDETISSILAVKLACPESKCNCYDFRPSKYLIRIAETAATRYNKEHSSN